MADAIDSSELRYIAESGAEVIGHVGSTGIAELGRCLPVRIPPSYARQRHYPGLLWTRTTRSHVVYESLLERNRILLADFDPVTVWISAQPFWVNGEFGGRNRRHCPDFLLHRDDNTFVVVDVKNPRIAAKAEAQEVFAWTRQISDRLGAEYEVWTGADRNLLNNVRFLAQARRESRAKEFDEHIRKLQCPISIGDAETQLGDRGIERPRRLLLELIWTGALTVELDSPLGQSTMLNGAE